MNKRKIVRRLKNGCVHIYTGMGKGKSTAAIGIGMRAVTSGLKVCMFQFLKRYGSSAENGLSLPRFKVVCFDQMHPMFRKGYRGWGIGYREKIKKHILRDLRKVKKTLKAGRYDVIILDEIINCVSEKFIPAEAVIKLISLKPKHVELVLTGRGATGRLIRCADYVSSVDKLKHPFDKGMIARKGIEF